MGKRGSVYETLVRTYNRDRKNITKVTCECGKEVFETQMERHIQTKMHAELIRQLERYNNYLTKETQEREKRIEYITTSIQKYQDELLQLQSIVN